ncbi:MAG: hypothetical protein KIH64_010860 [Mycobacterium sp.]|nr:hypothetical protein [Mycobacterium sp.]
MRIVALVAASALVAGCSQVPVGKPGPTELTPITPSRTGSASKATSPATTTTATTTSASAAAPGRGASAAEAIAWVEAAPPVDGADFNVALRNGTATSLGDDTAFTTPFGTSCMTDTKRVATGLACLVNLVDPPAQPPDVYGAWKGGWVDYDGSGVRIGSAHGDPGRFSAGQGAPLPQGGSLSFGDFRCRTDTTAMLCVNYADKTAVRYSDDGIDVFGCTRQTPPQAGIGIQYTC